MQSAKIWSSLEAKEGKSNHAFTECVHKKWLQNRGLLKEARTFFLINGEGFTAHYVDVYCLNRLSGCRHTL